MDKTKISTILDLARESARENGDRVYIREKAGKLLESVSLFDVYRGAQIAAGKKSVAYSILLRAADRTLTVEECDKMMNSIFTALEGIGAEVRR